MLEQFKAIDRAPVVQTEKLTAPVVLDRLEFYQNKKHYFLKATSKDGAVGIASLKPRLARIIYPIFYRMIAPLIEGQDVRNWDAMLEQIYLQKLNYKWQGFAFWVSVAYTEIAVLDMLGRIAGQSIGELLGGRVREEVDIYYASGNRENSAMEEVAHMQKLIDKSGAKAIKFRLGARMHTTDFSDARDRQLIPALRRELGDDVTIYSDANGSYSVEEAIRTGQILQEHNVAFFEEPCRFDHYEETKAVADALDIPIAGGEEEASTRQFMWLLENRALQVVQPDILIHGGWVRCKKIAKMAALLGIDCTPHISGRGLGFLYMMHFASCTPNIGAHQEFKGNDDQVPVVADTTLQPKNGRISIPTKSGLGVEFDADWVRKATLIKSI